MGRLESGRLSERGREKGMGLCLAPGPIPASTARGIGQVAVLSKLDCH